MTQPILFQRLYKKRDLAAWMGSGHADTLPTNVWRLFWHFLKPVRKRWLLLGSVSIVNQQMLLLNSYGLKHIIDGLAATAQPNVMAESLWLAVAAATPLLLFILLRVILNWVMWFISYRTLSPFDMHMRAKIYAYVQRHRPEFFDNQLSGRIIQKK